MKITGSNLKKQYGNKVVLNIPHIELEIGNFYGIIGPNGAGKTTLLHILAGIDTAFQGTVESLEKVHPQERTLLFQQPYMLRGSVEYNVSYPLQLRGMSKEDRNEIVKETLELLELTYLKNQSAQTLSGGERQRVAVARSLVFFPKQLYMDEPTASADAKSTQLIEQVLREKQKKQDTYFMITHSLGQAKRMCSHLLFLNQGKCIETGTCHSLLSQPQTPELQEYISLQSF